MANIRQLRDKDGEVYPVTHGDGIVNGTIGREKLNFPTGVEIIGKGTDNQAWKYPDGRLICMIRVSARVNVTSSWGSCYVNSDKIIPPNWAVQFKYPPTQSITINQSGLGSWLDVEEPYADTSKVRPSGFYAVRPNSLSGDIVVGCVGYGYWK